MNPVRCGTKKFDRFMRRWAMRKLRKYGYAVWRWRALMGCPF